MPSTFVHGLLPAGCLMASLGYMGPLSKSQKLKLLFFAFFMGNSPDLDVLFTLIRPDQFHLAHRYWGHNIFTLLFFTATGAWVLRNFISKSMPKRTALLVTAVLVFSHVFLDACGGPNHVGVRTGVPLFYPFSDWQMVLPIQLFSVYHVDKSLHPLIAHATSKDYWMNSMLKEFIVIGVGISLWTVAHRVRRLMKNRSLAKHAEPVVSEDLKAAS